MFKSFFFELFLKKGPLPSIAKGNNKKELFFSSLHTEKAREFIPETEFLCKGSAYYKSSCEQNLKKKHILDVTLARGQTL